MLEAGGSSIRNGSCLGLVTRPFAPICSIAWSVQVSVSSTADTGDRQRQPKQGQVSQRQAAVCGCSRVPVGVGAVSKPAGHVLTSACFTLCQVFVPVLCVPCPSSVVLLQTITVKGL